MGRRPKRICKPVRAGNRSSGAAVGWFVKKKKTLKVARPTELMTLSAKKGNGGGLRKAFA